MKIDKQVIFTIAVGVMMITWAIGMALSYNIPTGGQQIQIENIYREPISGQQKVGILRAGFVIIEYQYIPGEESLERIPVYESFISRFSDFAVLLELDVQYENETLNQMLTPTGDVIPLENVTEFELVDIFCENTFVQPRECLLRSI
ncbi:MAG: hypothetical protein JSV63_03975 [Candidatus Aenigmatarchaeota archaeon]|nr:MAG: hypothetical protein JSV63_03975 [Candidatus Aenigmarchaeota archaeon]